MSYILDALRRADAERERGEVPGLRSQQHTLLPDDDAPAPRSRALLGVIAALVVALLAALGWNFLGGRPAVESPVASAPNAAAPTPSPLLAPPVAVPAPTLTTPAASSTAAAVIAASVSPPARTTLAAAGPDAAAAARKAARRPAAVPASRADTPASAAGPGNVDSNRIYAIAELPENVRRDLPRLAVGGASYSGDAASRMVILNGQIFHEGDKVGAGHVLEKIRFKSAVLAYKGFRYELAY